jgi:Tol biopolymer transport system component
MCRRQRTHQTLCLLTLWLLVIGVAQAPWSSPPAVAQTAPGTIAYVRSDTSDEIRLIEPDGSNDRRLWAHGLADPHAAYGIYNMAWRPDGRELAFASTHENWCSINYSDVFAVAASGGGYRRITQAPACAALASYPRGTVRVPVKNVSMYGSSFTGFVYFQGAPSVLPVSLPAGASTVLTFNDVADFGPDFLQIAAFIDGANREYSVGTAVDVQASVVVTAGSMPVTPPQNMGQEPRSPTWSRDGATLGYAYGYASLYGISANPDPVDFGARLINPTTGPNIVEYMAYGPVTSRAQQILYQGYDAAGSDGIYLVTEGSTEAGELLVSSEMGLFQGLAWLPDGSGFVYSVEVYDEELYEITRANLFEYSFATRQSRPITSFDGAFAGQMSVSPDGREIVFERSASRESDAATDLWVIGRAGGEPRLLVRNAASPAWSPGALPPPLLPRAHLPLLRR